MKNSALVLALLSTVPAFAAVTVSTPAPNSTVNTTFALKANATACSSQAIGAMGYSFDSSANTTIVSGNALSANVSVAAGSHVLHVKSWGNRGSSCVTDVSLTVKAPVVVPPVTNVVVSAPSKNASLQSPFTLNAAGSLCESQKIAALGYSLDGSSQTSIVDAQTMSAQVTASTGTHVLHVKSWGNGGSACVTDVPLTIEAPTSTPGGPSSSGPQIPAEATVVKSIQNLKIWKAQHDVATGTNSSADGAMTIVASPSVSGSARQFDTTYSGYGGERYHVSIAPNKAAKNFVYDTQVYIASPITTVANIEMDLNQVVANGDTIIYGFQCDGWSGTWDYTENQGTTASPNDHWLHSNQACNPQDWAPDTWHHVQIQYSRDDNGNVTYQSVWLDGQEQDINATVPSAFSLHWGGTLLANFQIDGLTGTTSNSTIYMDNFAIYAW